MVAGSVLTKIFALVGMRPEDRSARRRQRRSSSTRSPCSSAAPNSAYADSRPVPRAPRDKASKPRTVRSFSSMMAW